MRLQQKSISRISLSDILRKKRSTLKDFLDTNGIASYELLVSRCGSLGVSAPSELEFLEAKGNPVTPEFSSPTEGIVVINPIGANAEAQLEQTAAETVAEEDVAKPSRKKKKNSDE
jgi:hypothetical protein